MCEIFFKVELTPMLSYGVNQERLIQNLQISLIVFLIKILLLIFVISKRVKLIRYSFEVLPLVLRYSLGH